MTPGWMTREVPKKYVGACIVDSALRRFSNQADPFASVRPQGKLGRFAARAQAPTIYDVQSGIGSSPQGI